VVASSAIDAAGISLAGRFEQNISEVRVWAHVNHVWAYASKQETPAGRTAGVAFFRAHDMCWERKTGFEPATFSLARRCSTTEPLPRRFCPSMIARRHNPVNSTNVLVTAAATLDSMISRSQRCPILFFQEPWSALDGLPRS
jgi:hypothetical protein